MAKGAQYSWLGEDMQAIMYPPEAAISSMHTVRRMFGVERRRCRWEAARPYWETPPPGDSRRTMTSTV
eukprot:CAMPEP_0201648784 /NCGR_PEP_ID=MMETSP0493-20130528/38271_1 /ASSEMBLY_ACC=CAM_ASM_000838 /TAXON_ID=420259 /ORGANISM="Thalassiosira gravida, Strain GMp14c1" /LENGTH=67 /DNA_ID=CAMNT_0048124509 /DNA_START=91 /DNA_END=291 /DNA_ORIENTATION=-